MSCAWLVNVGLGWFAGREGEGDDSLSLSLESKGVKQGPCSSDSPTMIDLRLWRQRHMIAQIASQGVKEGIREFSDWSCQNKLRSTRPESRHQGIKEKRSDQVPCPFPCADYYCATWMMDDG